MTVFRVACFVLLLFLPGGCATSSVSRITLFTGQELQQTGIEVRGSLNIRELEYAGELLAELSGIAWDEDESILYAVSDEGVLFHLQLQFRGDSLVDAKVTAAWPLQDEAGKRLTGKWKDSEGLAVILSNNAKLGDTQLLVAFERRPRIVRYSVQGEFLGTVDIPDELEDRKSYFKSNKALESLAIHPVYGVITSPEYPLKADADDIISIFSQHGKIWGIRRSPIENAAVVAMEVLNDGSVLILQRAYKSPFHPLIIILSQVVLDESCEMRVANRQNSLCVRVDLATLSTAKGWALDNFEGLTMYNNNAFLMVSDNNGAGIQRTLLTYFHLAP